VAGKSRLSRSPFCKVLCKDHSASEISKNMSPSVYANVEIPGKAEKNPIPADAAILFLIKVLLFLLIILTKI